MASIKIYEKRPVLTKTIKQDFSINSSIDAPQGNVSIDFISPVITKNIKQDFSVNTSISSIPRESTILSTLPFRIRLTAIRIEADGPDAVPPIPLQIIGFSNYIL
jgi:hypothetical protein